MTDVISHRDLVSLRLWPPGSPSLFSIADQLAHPNPATVCGARVPSWPAFIRLRTRPPTAHGGEQDTARTPGVARDGHGEDWQHGAADEIGRSPIAACSERVLNANLVCPHAFQQKGQRRFELYCLHPDAH